MPGRETPGMGKHDITYPNLQVLIYADYSLYKGIQANQAWPRFFRALSGDFEAFPPPVSGACGSNKPESPRLRQT